MSKLYPATILLPDFDRVDGRRYAVVACDQYTSEPAYWQALEKEIGDSPSTLRMILPEVYLAERAERLPSVLSAMQSYRESILVSHPDAMIYLRRESGKGGVIREGLVVAIDLLDYEFGKGAKSPIRPTEGTVTERIPPRLDIRRDACLELPHVMLLVERGEEIFSLLRPLADLAEPLYDTELMLGGGHATGYLIPSELRRDLEAALDREEARAREISPDAPLLYAVGDGNHSLATAKAHFEEIQGRLGDAALSHPARYALVEVCALDSPALAFHPIYRALFDADETSLLAALKEEDENGFEMTLILPSGEKTPVRISRSRHHLAVGALDSFLSDFICKAGRGEVDYIHGEDSLSSIAKERCAFGFLFDGMEKDELFPYVSQNGPLPRKTFSMGEAYEKRSYMEAREIV